MASRPLFVMVAFFLAMVGVTALKSQRQPVVVRPVPADVSTGTYNRMQLSVAAAPAQTEQASHT